MPATVLAAAHGPDAPETIAVAVDLARLRDASVVVAGIYVAPAGPYARAYEQAAREALQRDLDAAAAAIPHDVPHTVLVHRSSGVVRGLHELAERDEPAAIVVGATHLGGLGRAVHGDVAVGLLQDAPCAIVVAPAGWASQDRPLAQRSIGVAWDGGAEADLALEEAVRLAERTGATLRLIHVVEDLPRSAALDFPDDEALERSRRERAHALVEDVRGRIGQRCALETIVLEGVDAAHALVDASAGLDLLVLGSRGYGAVRRVLLGSVSSRVVHRAACPVLVLPRAATIAAATADGGVPAHAAG